MPLRANVRKNGWDRAGDFTSIPQSPAAAGCGSRELKGEQKGSRREALLALPPPSASAAPLLPVLCMEVIEDLIF